MAMLRECSAGERNILNRQDDNQGLRYFMVSLTDWEGQLLVIRRRETISKTQLTIILAFERVREIWK